MNTKIDTVTLKELYLQGLSDYNVSIILQVSEAQCRRLRIFLNINTKDLELVQSFPNEQWKPILSYEGLYEISNQGRVKSVGKNLVRSDGKTFQFWKGKIIQTFPDQDSYLRAALTKDRKRKSLFVHRLVAITFVPNPNNLPVVNHLDGNKLNNNDWNLQWCTPKENHTHALLNNLDKGIAGENNPKAKLTRYQVNEIINSKDVDVIELSNNYDVHPHTIKSILNNKTWRIN